MAETSPNGWPSSPSTTAATLRLLRTVPLGSVTSQRGTAVRCADARANRVGVLPTGRADESDALDLVTVRGTEKVEKVDAARGPFAAATGAGFVTRRAARVPAGVDGLGRPARPRVGATTLKVLRTVRLGTTPSQQSVAVRCADARADRVDVFVRDGNEDYAANLLTVRGSKVSSADAGHGADGSTVAVFAYRSKPRGDALVTIDVESGERLGEWSRDQLYASGLAWTASGTLLLRDQDAYMPRAVPVRAFDRTLMLRSQWPDVADEWAGRFTAAGEAAVVYGGGTGLTATPRTGTPLVADSLRLAAASRLVAVPGAEFGADEATSEPSDAPSDEVTVADEPDPSSIDTGLLTALGAAAAVGGVAAAFVVGRLSNH